MSRETSGYDALTLSVRPADVDRAIAELWARGTLGLESREDRERVVLIAYFERDRHSFADWVEGEGNLAGLEVVVRSFETLEDRDWLEEHRLRIVPFALGSRFWVDAGEPDSGGPGSAAPAAGRIPFRLPARRAFGTGSHETTRLVVEFLESMTLEGKELLDVGCGSGVLSFVAAQLGAASVVALEADPIAALLAGQNQELNQISFPLLAGRIEALSHRASFDLAMVNVIPERIAPDLGGISRRLRSGAGAIFSGCLVEHALEYRLTLEEQGFAIVGERDLGEWRAFLTRWGSQ